jgi:hypothetical protein
LLGAAALGAFGVADRLTLNLEKCNGRRRSLGHPVHDGGRHVGHLSPLRRFFLAPLTWSDRHVTGTP